MSHTLSAVKQGIFLFMTGCLLNISMLSQALAHESKAPPFKVPTTIPAIWQAIDEQKIKITKAIEENQLANVHSAAFAIRDLVHGLSALKSHLSPEQVDTVKRDSGYVEQLAGRLDKTADANDKEGTIANYDKLKNPQTPKRVFILN
ncbi:MAG: transporter [Legionella sp.]|nr:transporter [Legionella sp.]